jgi:mRNA interferase RelE/StbE
MKLEFRSSFVRDLKDIKDQEVLNRVEDTIKECEVALEITQIRQIKKLSGPGNFYRLRIGDYRIGIARQKDRIEFVRCLHRRDLYRFFLDCLSLFDQSQ